MRLSGAALPWLTCINPSLRPRRTWSAEATAIQYLLAILFVLMFFARRPLACVLCHACNKFGSRHREINAARIAHSVPISPYPRLGGASTLLDHLEFVV